MKDTKTKEAFIQLRAEGKSYSNIAKELKISKGTCTSWERELRDSIDELKQERLEDLYNEYQITREGRIKRLSNALNKIDTALSEKDYSELPADRLLSIKLKYENALQEEYKEAPVTSTDNTMDSILEQYDQLYKDLSEQKIKPSEVKAKLSILRAKEEAIKTVKAELDREEGGDISKEIFYKSKLLRKNLEA